jgi:hypothetical protein
VRRTPRRRLGIVNRGVVVCGILRVVTERRLEFVGVDRETGETIITPISTASADAIWLAYHGLADPFDVDDDDEDDDERDV